MSFPYTRPRRLRQHHAIRELVAQTSLESRRLIQPVFILDQADAHQAITTLPGIYRHGINDLMRYCEQCVEAGIHAIALFPNIESSLKDAGGSYSLREDGLIPQTIQRIKARFPELMVMTDIALDPYTSHGQDGLLAADGEILNDATNGILAKMAKLYAASGADIVAPSDMMDGRVGIIRSELEASALTKTLILAYSAKYASAYYGPFRDAVGSSSTLQGDKKTYQMDFRNRDEALQEVALDIEEGADAVMVKPAGAYLDIIAKISDTFSVPTFAYQVSGEYAMLKLAVQHNLAKPDIIEESLISIFRAGAQCVLTYAALELCQSD